MIAFIIIILLLVIILMKMLSSGSSGYSWTIYGSDGCGWCKKQKEYMNKKGIKYSFINCSSGSCDGITSFPTLKNMETGEVKIGYNEV